MLVLKTSCCKLLAAKYSIDSIAGIYKKFGKHLTAEGAKDGDKPLTFVNPSYINTHKFNVNVNPIIRSINTVGISEASLKGLSCSICGSTYRVEMHHIRKMKDLNPNLSSVDRLMAQLQRKQIPLCRSCHLEKHRKK
jgi:hypothetical protein